MDGVAWQSLYYIGKHIMVVTGKEAETNQLHCPSEGRITEGRDHVFSFIYISSWPTALTAVEPGKNKNIYIYHKSKNLCTAYLFTYRDLKRC